MARNNNLQITRFMKTSLTLITLSIIMCMTSCGPEYSKPGEASQKGFALSFFNSVNKMTPKGENVVVSPYSAAVALSMLAEGAEGETRVEFDNALGGVLYKAEDLGGNDTVKVESANSVWVDDNFSIRNRYVSLLQNDFDAFITTQNFADPATVRAINNWCSENTNGKIDNIIDRLDPGMVMILANALYFNAPWEDEFDPSMTTEQVFHGVTKDTDVKMMSRKAFYNYAEYNGIQMIHLPYAGMKYGMYVVLPPKGADIDKLLPEVTPAALDAAFGMFAQEEVRFSMPKFRLETSMVLNKALNNMGIKTAFTSAADFGGIAEMGPLVLDQVKQKCFIDVAEKGTEAAAVTVGQIRLTSVRPVQNVKTMKVDRPFVFLISDLENKNILFAGKIVNL